MEHSKHYPTMIENPKTGQRKGVATPLAHHRQNLAWGLEGLDPEPEEPPSTEPLTPVYEPGFPTMIENAKTGERVRVNSQAEQDLKEKFWAAKQPKSTTRQAAPPPPPPPPPPAAQGKATSSATKASAGKAGNATSGKANGNGNKTIPLPPTKEDFIAKNFQPSVAERMADEEVRKYNAGEPPYDGK